MSDIDKKDFESGEEFLKTVMKNNNYHWPKYLLYIIIPAGLAFILR